MDDREIREKIMEMQSGGRISCKQAFELSDQTGLPRMKIGRLLDEMEIKIHTCQLGCFK